MFLFLALFTVTPNLGGTFRLGKNPTSLTLIKGHCVEYEIILFSFYLSIYLPIRLNPRRGHQTGSGEPSAGG